MTLSTPEVPGHHWQFFEHQRCEGNLARGEGFAKPLVSGSTITLAATRRSINEYYYAALRLALFCLAIFQGLRKAFAPGYITTHLWCFRGECQARPHVNDVVTLTLGKP